MSESLMRAGSGGFPQSGPPLRAVFHKKGTNLISQDSSKDLRCLFKSHQVQDESKELLCAEVLVMKIIGGQNIMLRGFYEVGGGGRCF